MNINCPKCGALVHMLHTHCKTCGLNIQHFVAIQERISELEAEASVCLTKKNWLDAYGLYAVLLEYKPSSVKYLINLATASIALGDIPKAEEIEEGLSRRLNKSKDLEVLRELLRQKKQEPQKG